MRRCNNSHASAEVSSYFLEKLQSAFIKNKHGSGSLGLDEEDDMLLAVFHGPAVPSRPYFSAVLSG